MPFTPVLREFSWFFFPLRRAVASGEGLAEFMALFGYKLSASDLNGAMGEITGLSDALDDLVALWNQIMATIASGVTDIDQSDQAAIAAAGLALYQNFDQLANVVSNVIGQPPEADLPIEVFDRLLDMYLDNRAPTLREVLRILEARSSTFIPAAPNGRALDFTRIRYNFARVGDAIADTGQWADDTYGWGRDFDYKKAIRIVADLVETFGGRAQVNTAIPAVAAAYLDNIPVEPVSPEVPNTTAPIAIPQAQMPVLTAMTTAANGDVTATGEAGVKVLPTGDMTAPKNLGLAVAPYADGTIEGVHDLSDALKFTWQTTGSATGGRSILIRPSGIETDDTSGLTGTFQGMFSFKTPGNPGGEPIRLLGKTEGTRLETTEILASFGGSLDGDFFIAGGFRGLAAVIDPGDDGLLSALIADPITVTAGDVLMGARPGRGIYFEGGSSLKIDIPLDLDLDLLRIMGLGIELDWSDGFAVDTTFEGELEIGPVYAYADGIGVRTKVLNQQGLLGKYDLEFGFIPPTGYAVALDIPAVQGGGLITYGDSEYSGALALQFESIGFSAFAILNTELPGGQAGFSFAASLFAEFSVALGYGFFLTGVGGILGINRTIDTDAMRDILYDGSLDNLVFPNDPIQNAATILDDMAAILPPRTGQHVFGPVARISWGVPSLINIKLGVIVEVGNDFRLLILGGLDAVLPSEDAAIMSLKISFFGEIDFAAQTISFDATLQGSRILTFTLSGDAAIRTGWASGIEHVVSFGGLHPQFPRPSNLPELRRISIAFGSNNPRVSLTGYTALTMNSLQFGADARIYAKGPKILGSQLAAEGWAYFNALVYFDPFAFTANLGGGLKLLRNGKEICGLGFDLTLSGPNVFKIDGKVWVTVFGQDIKFDIRHSWGSAQSLPAPTVSAVATLQNALAGATISPANPATLMSSVRRRTLAQGVAIPLDPRGGARVSQNRIPLDIRIDRIGEAVVSGPRNVGLSLTRNGMAVVDPKSVQQDFVHGHFFTMTEAERLRATAYDRLKSGVVLGQADLVSNASKRADGDYSYEIIEIPEVDDRDNSGILPLPTGLGLSEVMRNRVQTAERMGQIGQALELQTRVTVPDPIVALAPDYVSAATVTDSIITAASPAKRSARTTSFAEVNLGVDIQAEATVLETGDRRAVSFGVASGNMAAVPGYFVAAAAGFAAGFQDQEQ
jgi:uncharacterized protein DUF6603